MRKETTIKLTYKIKKKLAKLKKNNDTFEDVIIKLLKKNDF